MLANERLPRTPEADFRRSFLPDRTPVGTPQRFVAHPQYQGTAGRGEWAFRWSRPSTGCESRWRARPARPPSLPPLGRRVRCPFDASVEVAWHEVLYQPVRCLYVLPPSGGRTLSLTLPDGPAADALLLEAGITWEHAWFPDRAPWSSGWRAPPVCSTSAFPPGTGVRGRRDSGRGNWTVDPARLTTANPTTVSCACAPGSGRPMSRAPAPWTVASPSDWAWSPSWCSGHRAPGGVRARRGVYFAAAEQFSRWWALLFQRPAAALSDAVITQAFDFNHEHPMLAKSLFGWSHTLTTRYWAGSVPRRGSASAFALALIPALLHLWGSVLWGRRAGLFAALSFFVVPRHFFHAHLSCFDMPVAAMWLLVVYLFWRAEEDLRLAPWTGVAFGLALATKHNAFFLPLVLTPLRSARGLAQREHGGRRLLVRMGQAALAFLAYLGLVLMVKGRPGLVQSWQLLSPQTFGVVALVVSLSALALRLRRRDPAALVRVAPLVAMGLIGPVVFFVHLAVPLVPPGGAPRLVLRLPRRVHALPGPTSDRCCAPVAYVFVVTAMTLPVSLLLPMGVGLLRTGVRNLGDLVPALGRRFGQGGETEWLLGVNALFSILLISHPEVPHFGGVKHWLPRCVPL